MGLIMVSKTLQSPTLMGKVSVPIVIQPGCFKKHPRLESEVFMTCFLVIISGVCM